MKEDIAAMFLVIEEKFQGSYVKYITCNVFLVIYNLQSWMRFLLFIDIFESF